ncbi:hypothetical protein AA309_31475 [Microvirga vignae]|uniref:Transposase n=1 Tax=Microvirga vignae TaxID=1225564 RepID=A0A0H1R3R0_9HYPH|nr:hypothetical protein AA309_31475 [Microvirga vignae]
MTNPMMDLKSLVEKTPDADLLREMISFVAERLMELEVGALTGRRVRNSGPSATATANATGTPSPASRTMRARQTTFWGVLRWRTRFSRRSRSAAGTSMRSILPISAASHIALDFGNTRQ